MNSFACSSILIPNDVFVNSWFELSLLSWCFEYQQFKDFLKINNINTNSFSKPSSIFFTSKFVNFAMIKSIVTIFIPF